MPNLPEATGLLGGMTRKNMSPENLARAAAEAVISNLSRGLEAISEQTEPFSRLMLIGGGAQNAGVQRVVSEIVSLLVIVPDPGEYVAYGAARQAAWVLTGSRPGWKAGAQELMSPTIHSPARRQFDTLLEGYLTGHS
jgi:xylulokinase